MTFNFTANENILTWSIIFNPSHNLLILSHFETHNLLATIDVFVYIFYWDRIYRCPAPGPAAQVAPSIMVKALPVNITTKEPEKSSFTFSSDLASVKGKRMTDFIILTETSLTMRKEQAYRYLRMDISRTKKLIFYSGKANLAKRLLRSAAFPAIFTPTVI